MLARQASAATVPMLQPTLGEVAEKLQYYASTFAGITDMSQGAHFAQWVRLDDADFAENFALSGLNRIFTSPKIRTASGFNCNSLRREQLGMFIYSDQEFCAFVPIGEPGRDLINSDDPTRQPEPIHPGRFSHFVVARHMGTAEAYKYSDMLPANDGDLESRLAFASKAAAAMEKNLSVRVCGAKARAAAAELGLDADTPIREVVAAQILDYRPREGDPGMKLLASNGENVWETKNKDLLLQSLNATWDHRGIRVVRAIQTPAICSQAVAHIHVVRMHSWVGGESSLPLVFAGNYINADAVSRLKNQVPLARQSSLAQHPPNGSMDEMIGESSPAPESKQAGLSLVLSDEDEEEDCALSRTRSCSR